MRTSPFSSPCRLLTSVAVLVATFATILGAADIDFSSPHAAFATGSSPRTVAIGRLDNNTSNDLVIGNANGNSLTVLFNNGSGGFVSPLTLAVPGNPSSVAVVELNGDGKNDIVVANQITGGKLSVFLGNGDGTFQSRQDYAASSALVAMRVVDIGADGTLDVIAGGTGIDFFKSNGSGGFNAPERIVTTGSIFSISVGDLTGDGVVDILCTRDSELTTLTGVGNGTFGAPVIWDTGAPGLSVGIGDFNGDGRNDLAKSHYYGPLYGIAVLLNQGGGAFGPPIVYPTDRSPKSIMVDDLNADGALDIVCVNRDSKTVGILRGKGDGTFYPHVGYLTGAVPQVDAVGDLDGNGSPDLAVANQAANSVSVLLQGTGAAPSPVTTLTTDVVSDRSARLTWTAPLIESYGPLTTYDLRMKVGTMVAGDFASATPVLPGPAVLPTGTTTTHGLTGLTPATTYSLAMTVTDAFGRVSGLSNITTFTTAVNDNTPPATPSLSLSTSGTTGSASYAVLRWTAPGDDGPLGVASSYNLRLSTVPITDLTSFSNAAPVTTTTPLPAGQQEELTLTGLTPGAIYYVAMTASDEVPLTSNRSTSLRIIPPAVDATAPGRITDLAVIATTATTATLRWTAQGDDGLLGGPATTFDVRWSDQALDLANFSTLGVPVTGVPVPGTAGTVHEVVVTGLPDQTLCYFALVVSDEVPNTSALSNLASTTTADGTAPAAITNLAVSSSTAQAISLTWSAPGDDQAVGTASAYDVRYSTSPITAGNFTSATAVGGVAAPLVAGSSESLTITGLTAGTTYYVAIRSQDEIPNTSALSNVVSGTTTSSGSGSGSGSGGGGSGGGCGLGSGLAALLLAIAGMLLLNVARVSRR